jgi:hypothetical protein
MRMPHLRLREFLLLTTMASLIAASFAIRARTASHLSAQDHAFRAYRERVSAKWLEGNLKQAKWKLEQAPHISPDQVAGYDVRLMNSATIPWEIPTTGRQVVIVAQAHPHGTIFFRIFDGDGRVVVDWAEGGEEQRGAVEEQLASLWPPHELTAAEREWVIVTVISFLERTRDAMQASVFRGWAKHAETVARAEYHERLARRP